VIAVPDAALDEVRDVGFTLVEGFLQGDELAEAQEAVYDEFPSAEKYFSDPEHYGWVNSHQFSGLRKGPLRPLALNRIGHHPDLIDAAERFCGSTDIDFYHSQLWAKYSGGADYDQEHHRDFGNHNLVVPREDRRWPQMTTFVFLSDITEEDGPTMVVPREHTGHIPIPDSPESEDLRRYEVPVVGPAGSLMIYTTDVFHRGSSMTGERRSRFSYLANYMQRGAPWMGRSSWANTPGTSEVWDPVFADCSPRQREIYGFPPVGHEYWNEQTVRDTATRYPSIDMAPYATAISSKGRKTDHHSDGLPMCQSSSMGQAAPLVIVSSIGFLLAVIYLAVIRKRQVT
jgi:hypothetical protein